MENYDAFSEGVEPGGLRNRNEIKILIAYLVRHLEIPVTKEQVVELVCEEGIANYFDLTQAFSELESNKTIFISESGELSLNPVAVNDIIVLEHDVPYSIREKAFNAAVNLQTRLRRERENKIVIEKNEKGYNVLISILDNNDELMSIKIYVADYEMANSVKEKFLSDPAKIYSNIVSLLMA